MEVALRLIKFLILFCLIHSTIAYSFNQEDILGQAFKQFKLGSYPESIKLLENKKFSANKSRTQFYILGLSHARLQQHDIASNYFRKSLTARSNIEIPRDIYYELGQSFYAQNELQKASLAFKKSYKRKFKVPTSLYYLGHISQIFEQHKKSKSYYELILKDKSAPKEIQQVARFQLAESLLALAKEHDNPRRIVKKYIIPQLDIALKVMPKSDPAKDIKKRKKELLKEFGLDPNTMINGNKVSSKRWKLSLSHQVTYDNNITLTSDLPTTQATQQDSFVFDTEFNSSYFFVINQRYVIKPKLKISKTKHGDQGTSSVFTNDATNIYPSLQNKFEHKLFQKPSTLLLNADYTFTQRDYNSDHNKRTYARSIIYTLGEKIKFFKFGPTTLKIKQKYYRGYLDTLHNDTFTFALDQLIFMPGGKILILTFNRDSIDNFNDTANSTSSTLIRGDYIWSNIIPTYSLLTSLSYTKVTPDTTSSSLDVETSIEVAFEVSKDITKNLKQTFGWSYLKQTAEIETSEYTKHKTHYELTYEF